MIKVGNTLVIVVGIGLAYGTASAQVRSDALAPERLDSSSQTANVADDSQKLDSSCSATGVFGCGGQCSVSCATGKTAVCDNGQSQCAGTICQCLRRPSCACQ